MNCNYFLEEPIKEKWWSRVIIYSLKSSHDICLKTSQEKSINNSQTHGVWYITDNTKPNKMKRLSRNIMKKKIQEKRNKSSTFWKSTGTSRQRTKASINQDTSFGSSIRGRSEQIILVNVKIQKEKNTWSYYGYETAISQ